MDRNSAVSDLLHAGNLPVQRLLRPGAILCAAGFGIAGGMGAGPVGQNAGHAVVEGLELMADTPRFIETSNLMFGTPESRRAFYEMRELETGERDPLLDF